MKSHMVDEKNIQIPQIVSALPRNQRNNRQQSLSVLPNNNQPLRDRDPQIRSLYTQQLVQQHIENEQKRLAEEQRTLENYQRVVENERKRVESKVVEEEKHMLEIQNRLDRASSLKKELYDQLQEMDTEEKDLCKICFEEPSCIVFLPCKHHLTCMGCAEKVSMCPSCRGPIRERIDLRTIYSQ